MPFLDAIREPELKELYRFWLGKRQGRPVPLRRDIRPAEIDYRYLPNLFIYRREADGRFRCILIGTEMVSVFHRDETGMFLDEILPPSARENRLALFARCVDESRPVYYAGPAMIHTRERRSVARLLLPLASDGALADHIFGMALFGPVLENPAPGRPSPKHDAPEIVAVADDADIAPDS